MVYKEYCDICTNTLEPSQTLHIHYIRKFFFREDLDVCLECYNGFLEYKKALYAEAKVPLPEEKKPKGFLWKLFKKK